MSRHLRQHRVQVERGRLLPRRELDKVFDLRRYRRLHEVHLRDVINQPIQVALELKSARSNGSRRRLNINGSLSFTKGSAHAIVLARVAPPVGTYNRRPGPPSLRRRH